MASVRAILKSRYGSLVLLENCFIIIPSVVEGGVVSYNLELMPEINEIFVVKREEGSILKFVHMAKEIRKKIATIDSNAAI